MTMNYNSGGGDNQKQEYSIRFHKRTSNTSGCHWPFNRTLFKFANQRSDVSRYIFISYAIIHLIIRILLQSTSIKRETVSIHH